MSDLSTCSGLSKEQLTAFVAHLATKVKELQRYSFDVSKNCTTICLRDDKGNWLDVVDVLDILVPETALEFLASPTATPSKE